MEEVVGSIPTRSTKSPNDLVGAWPGLCASQLFPATARKRWPFTKKCVCHVLPRF